MKYIECLRVPKVGELARLRRKGEETGYAIFQVERVEPDSRHPRHRCEGVVIEVGEYARRWFSWKVDSWFIVDWGHETTGELKWEYHRLIEDTEAP